MGNFITLLKSKTVWGVVIAAAAWVVQQPHIDIATVLQGVGAVVTAAGVRDAIKKSAPTDSPDGQATAAGK